jgi:hypothetical protein
MARLAKWQAAVAETEQVWRIPHEEAAEIVTRLYEDATDAAWIAHAKAEMPQHQAELQNLVHWVASAVEMGLVSPVGINQLERAIERLRAPERK